MIAIYLATLVLGSAFMVARRFDVFTLALLSSAVYFLPAAVPFYPIQVGAYAIYTLVICSIVVGAALFDKSVRRNKDIDANIRVSVFRSYLRGSWTLLLPLMILVISTSSGQITSKGGQASGGLLHYSASVMLGFCFACSIVLRNRTSIFVCAALYAWFVMRGDRTQFVVAVLAVFTLLASYQRFALLGMLRKMRPYQVAIAVFALGVGVFGKDFYGAYFDYNSGASYGEALRERVQTFLNEPAARFEPYHVQSILNMAIESDDRVSPDYLADIPMQLLPLSGSLGGDVHAQSEIVKALYFGDWSEGAGVSSNFFAEGFLLFGYLGAVFFAGMYLVGIWIVALALRSEKVYVRLWAAFAGAFWAFYLHRSSLLQIIGHEKRILYAVIGLILVAFAVNIVRDVARSRNRTS